MPAALPAGTMEVPFAPGRSPDEMVTMARLRIGEWVADPATNELRRGSRIVRLEPKPMDVLMRLAARPGDVVSRDELLAEAWSGVVVSDETLTQAVARLRRALGDDAAYIETIAKRGYRLAAPVQPAGLDMPPAPRRHWLAWAAVASVLAAGLVSIHWSGLRVLVDVRVVDSRTGGSLSAYDAFRQAQSLFLVRQPAENTRARELYRKAIEIDPRFARAYTGLAMTYALEPRLAGSKELGPAIDKALELAESARRIDPGLAEVHWALGFIHAQARRHAQAIVELQRAIELNPSFADAYALMGGVHTYLGEPDKSIPLLRTAMRLDPSGGYLYYLLLGRAYLFNGNVEQALVNLREAAARNPADVETRLFLAAASVEAGNLPAAHWEVEEIRTLRPGFSFATWLADYPLASEPLRGKLRRSLAAAGL